MEETRKCNNIVIPYVTGKSEKLRRIFNKLHIPFHFNPSNTLRQKLVHPNVHPHAVQCSQNYTVLYVGETTPPLHKRMKQHRRTNSSGQDSAHTGSPSLRNPHEGQLSQRSTSSTNKSKSELTHVVNDSVRTPPHRATPLQLVRNEEASWMRGETSLRN